MGGISAEREISLVSGKAILSALEEEGYSVCSIDVDRNVGRKILEEGADVAFIALHGRWGEDGTIQGMLELMGIPYTGSGVMASALAMDKPMAKRIFMYYKLPTPKFQVFEKAEVSKEGKGEKVNLQFPVVVKPVSEGSTLGVNIVKGTEELTHAISEAGKYTSQVIIEEYINGSEITVGIVNGCPLPVIEIIPQGGFYDYKSKYTSGMTEYILPARLTVDQTANVQDIALKAYRAIGCWGAARVDMIMDSQGSPNIIEINTIPGMTKTSLLPKAAHHAGMSFNNLVEKIFKGARLHS